MKLKEVENFYKMDKQQYILANRPGFIDWYNENYIKQGLPIEQLQELVDKFIAWYMFRYPNRLLNESYLDSRFSNLKDISSEMSLKQLMYRLSESEISFFECKYHTNNKYCHNNHNYYGIDIIKGKTKLEDFSINENGNLSYNTQTKYNLPFQSIEDFYEENKDNYDMKNVLKCIKFHNNDLILRNHIIDAIRQGLLYYKHTTPEYGKYRMDKFTLEITSCYDDIDLENKKYVGEYAKNIKQKGFIKKLRGDKK